MLMNNATTTTNILAPISGSLYHLENIPDPVFAQKIMGDGFSIDPVSNEVLAPFSGTIKHIHRAGHALTIENKDGMEVLIHVGIDTVQLDGKGFKSHVKVGDKVAAGTLLIEFDLDFVAQNAKSLLTEVIFTNLEDKRVIPKNGSVIAGKDTACNLVDNTSQAQTSETAVDTNYEELFDTTKVGFAHGVHARPAARVINTAKSFKSEIFVYKGQIETGEKANAKSLINLLELELAFEEVCTVTTKGPDADLALEAMLEILASSDDSESEAHRQAKVAAPKKRVSDDENLVLGVCAAPGTAFGTIFQMASQDFGDIPEQGTDVPTETQSLFTAIEEAKQQIKHLETKLAKEQSDDAAIFAAHAELLDDPDLVNQTITLIDSGKSSAFAWQQSYLSMADRLVNLKNELFAARANDIKDVGQRVLRVLLGAEASTMVTPDNAIIIAEDLTPSNVVELDTSKVVGFCTTGGGPTSHVAILARGLNLPAVAGIEPRALTLENGVPALLDGTNGELRLNPPQEVIEKAKADLEEKERQHKEALKMATEKAVTKDGTATTVLANTSGLEETNKSVKLGGEGVGLLRSEFLFLNRTDAPSFSEQKELYKSLSVALGKERSLVIRTLDVGGDKPLPYLPQDEEENPFLGIRGARLSLRRQEIFREQVKAILEASSLGNVEIMFPMVGKLDEMRQLKAIVEEETKALGVPKVPCGIMVEIPSAALLAEQFASEVDFFSIGTNDLAQYTLAMDRNHQELAAEVDALDPAVLRLIEMTAIAGNKHNIPVSVCGGIASDTVAIPVLLGLGIRKFSVSSPVLPEVKALIRNCSTEDCKELAQLALEKDSATTVRSLSREFMQEKLGNQKR